MMEWIRIIDFLLIPTLPTLSDYQIRSVTEGMDAIGEVTVKVKEQGRSFVGHGASTDIIEASAKAYINAINKVIHFRENG